MKETANQFINIFYKKEEIPDTIFILMIKKTNLYNIQSFCCFTGMMILDKTDRQVDTKLIRITHQ